MAGDAPGGGAGEHEGVSPDVEEKLKTQQAVQDSITDELVELAGR